MLRAGRSKVPVPVGGMILSLPATLHSGVYLASNRSEYRKQKNNILGSKVRPVRGADNITAVYKPIV
jgi:hypothetical protein